MCYLIITHVKNGESKKQSFWICLSVIICLKLMKVYQYESISIKKEQISSYLVFKYCQFGQDGWKSRTFFMSSNWRWTCSQIFRKFRRSENLQLFWMMLKCSIFSSLDFEYRLWVIIFAQERALRQTFTYLKSTIETLKKSVKIIQS